MSDYVTFTAMFAVLCTRNIHLNTPSNMVYLYNSSMARNGLNRNVICIPTHKLFFLVLPYFHKIWSRHLIFVQILYPQHLFKFAVKLKFEINRVVSLVVS